MNGIAPLFKIKYPVVQGGMIWCSGWELASAVSNAGGLGLIGAGSMYPEVLMQHIQKCKKATHEPFGVNIPLLYPQTDDLIKIVLEEEVPIVFTSAGNPAKYTSLLKGQGVTVVHVVANKKFAIKAIEAGVDALVAEGFEAGGHNGYEETTTLVLVPEIRAVCPVPLIAAGGIATGAAMYAAMALGADGVQIGSRFVASEEASAHINFKKQVVEAGDGDTFLTLKKLVPVRLLRNEFFQKIHRLELEGASREELAAVLGRARAKRGMFEGDIREGELEIGQAAALINDILPVKTIMEQLVREFNETSRKMSGMQL